MTSNVEPTNLRTHVRTALKQTSAELSPPSIYLQSLSATDSMYVCVYVFVYTLCVYMDVRMYVCG